MVYRIFVEKKEGLRHEADHLKEDIISFLQIKNLEDLRLLNRYDVENITEELFFTSVSTVFSEPQLDETSDSFSDDTATAIFATEYLPGQFDQRADSAAQCVQIISKGERPTVRTAKVYALYGDLSSDEIEKIKKYVINPVEAREASLDKPETLATDYDIPTEVKTLEGFLKLDRKGLEDFVNSYGLAMDLDDIAFCQDYFKTEDRDPTITEIRMIDTYWSDHCRHTTFLTTIDSVTFEDQLLQSAYDEYIAVRKELGRTKPINLMDIGTIAAKYLKKQGKLEKLDESEEINACTVKIKVDVNGKEEDWLLLFKNETHNHPTEIEPFGGAATCIGGAIRDPLSGRSYVYGAMRVTGAADPLRPVDKTLQGKLPQKKIVTTAAAGYSSYGNQIGLATGLVDEIYHDGYAAKRMEIGAVIAAAPAENVRRERPDPGDMVILLGGRTGRDGCGGATGSSKSHNLQSLESCGAEVQKGNAPEERKLQRLFRNPDASLLIKRCNDFGAGGVSVAIGELADGLLINLDKVPKKYDGLDGTELAISESQERMAVVVEKKDVDKFMALAAAENLESTVVAEITAEPRLKMTWNGKTIVDISREFLNSNGAEKHIDIAPASAADYNKQIPEDFKKGMLDLAGDLNICSKRGLSERFDSTIGAGTVLMPFGGKNQITPIQAMAHKVSLEKGETDTCSLMAYGYNPFITSKSPYHGAYLAVVESVAKLIASGAKFEDVYLTFQEYFEKPMKDPKRWGKPLAALLGAFKAQKEFGIAAIGGKDSMSGSFEDLDVPPTLVSFAVTTEKCKDVISPEFKKAGSKVVLLVPDYDEKTNLPNTQSQIRVFNRVTELMREGKVLSAYTPTCGGIAEAVMKMCFGNGLGFKFHSDMCERAIFSYCYGSFILEVTEDVDDAIAVGNVTDDGKITFTHKPAEIELDTLLNIYENKLEPVFSCNIKTEGKAIKTVSYEGGEKLSPRIKVAKPKVLIPVFPGTNCEYDSARAAERAGLEAETVIIRNLTSSAISESTEYFAKKLADSQIVFIPGGFSGGDEPEGSGKFITAFFRSPEVREGVMKLLKERDGLMCGICNGFQALIKLGLVPYGEIIDTDDTCPTLTFNTIGRHQSRIVHTRVASTKSPWMSKAKVGEVYTVPISHGEGRFIASEDLTRKLEANGQILTQYVDLEGNPTDDVRFNPNNSVWAIEGITSPDGRVLGKMGHSERVGNDLYRNVEGNYNLGLFDSAFEYYK
ncbi:MAG: phosphoribosylformylglycinamidine synthase [Acutalibacteraceae bacterium]|nr:phosphoribosylformylglycinamidine synthase [Acutalibacteraceae bacterium]